MPLTLSISPHGRPFVEAAPDEEAAPASNHAVETRITAAFAGSSSHGLLHLATVELQATLSPPLDFAREFARGYLTQFCQSTGADAAAEAPPLPPPPADKLAATALQAPPMRGLEYLSADALALWW